MRSMLIGVVAVGLTCGSASAQYIDQRQLAQIRALVVTSDFTIGEGADQCLPSGDAMKTTAELILRRSGVHVGFSSELGRTALLEIGAVVVFTGGATCSIAHSVDVLRPSANSYYLLYHSMGVMVRGTARDPRGSYRSTVVERVEEIANEILKARED